MNDAAVKRIKRRKIRGWIGTEEVFGLTRWRRLVEKKGQQVEEKV